MIVEHNDVDIAPLFNWSKEFEITQVVGKDEEDNPITETVPVYMRLLGDADMNRARVASLRDSAALRRRLKDMDSDERLAYIKDSDEVSLDVMVSIIIVFAMSDLRRNAEAKLKIKLPKAPRSDAKTEAHEKYQAEIDSYPERRREELRAILEKDVEIMKLDLESKGHDYLYKEYVKAMIDEMCEREILRSFNNWCVYLGTYKNKELTERFFSSIEQFLNLESRLKQDFIEEYSSLELYGDDLKKLHRVTQ